MKKLPPPQYVPGRDGTVILMRAEIRMALPEGVMHFAQYGAQVFLLVIAQPKTDRIKDVAQHARHADKPDFPVGFLDVVTGQNSARPIFQTAAVASAMVAVVKTQRCKPVAGNRQGSYL